MYIYIRDINCQFILLKLFLFITCTCTNIVFGVLCTCTYTYTCIQYHKYGAINDILLFFFSPKI